MKNLRFLSVLLLTLTIAVSCEEAVEETFDELKGGISEELSDTEAPTTESDTEQKEAPQTVEERIQEIKELYAKIQNSPNQNKDCTSKSKTTINYDVIKEGYPFENDAKKCNLEDGLMYKQVTLRGYEWGETANLYYKDGQRFFVFVTGGAEAYGYEYRIYYNKNNEVIRILLAENDYDGQEVSAPFILKDENRREEILNGVDIAMKEIATILDEK
ncbi:MAG: hypothetical protein AB8B56_19305 [Crocinitomicaceae bacterium]